MSNYSNTKATIAANVYTNHNNEVTAEMVKTGINAVVDTLIAGGFIYKGVAHPGDAAVSPDANVFYIASEAGTYTNKGGLSVADGEVAILKYNGSWSKEVTGAATAAEVSALGQKVDGLALGKFYGFFPAAADLPAGDDAGYAYVGASAPFAIYVFDGSSWSDSGSVYSYPVGNGEDIDTNGTGQLQFANRISGDGMGYKILRKDATFASQVTAGDTIYEIRYDFVLGADVAIPSGSYLYFNGGSVTGANLTGAVINPELRPEWFGAVGDGSTDDADAFYRCISLAISSGARVTLSQRRYAIKSSKTFNLTGDIFIDGDGCTLVISNNANFWFVNPQYFSGNPSANIVRGAGGISFSSLPSGVAEGDIIQLVSTEIGESSYNTTRQQVARVGKISGTTLYMTDNATMDFTAANTTITLYKSHTIGISDVSLECNSGGNYHHLRVDHSTPMFSNVTIYGASSSYGIVLYGCVDGSIRNTTAMGIVYGYLANCCSHLTFDGVRCPKIIQHPVALAIFSNFIKIKDMSGMGALIESHVAFNVEYEDCTFACDSSRTWAGRAVGFTMRNCKVWSYDGTKVQPVLISSVALYDRNIYLDYATKLIGCDFQMDDLQIRESGLMEVRDCGFLPNTKFDIGGSAAYIIKRIVIRNSPNIAKVNLWKATYELDTDREVFDAVLSNGTYTIDLGMTAINMVSGSAEWCVKGKLSDVDTAASVAYPVVLKPQRSNIANTGCGELYINFDFTIYSSNRASGVSYAVKKYRAAMVYFPKYAASKLLRLDDLSPAETLIAATISDFSASGGTSSPVAQAVSFTINVATTIPSASAARISAEYECFIVGRDW